MQQVVRENIKLTQQRFCQSTDCTQHTGSSAPACQDTLAWFRLEWVGVSWNELEWVGSDFYSDIHCPLALSVWWLSWCWSPLMSPLCTDCPLYSTLTAAHWRNDCPELRGEGRRREEKGGVERRGEERDLTKSCLTLRTPAGQHQPVCCFFTFWLLVRW